MALDLEHIIRNDPLAPENSTTNHNEVVGGAWIGFPFLHEFVKTNAGAPAWWSPGRDLYLRDFVKTSDHVSSAKFAIVTRLTATPIRILAKNQNIQIHKERRDEMAYRLNNYSGFGEGWESEYNLFLDDVFTCDNGGFLEIMGDGNEWEPIYGLAYGVRHLDSSLCTRTDNPNYPVIYWDYRTGEQKVMHWKRIIRLSLNPSTDARMCKVGVSSVSRCLNMAERLIGQTNFILEKLGSRPLRAILTASGVSPEQMKMALAAAEIANDNARLTRFSKLVALATVDGKIDIDLVDLAKLPDGFDEEISTQIAMTLIATAFGVDLREIWTQNGSGATRADAVVSHMKSRGKTIGFITGFMEKQLNLKFLPDYLALTFDQNDDEADEMSTNLRVKRAQTNAQLLKASINSVRTVRQNQVRDGDISEAQFAYDELQEGRLPDGSSVLSLFQSEDADYKALLTVQGFPDPLDTQENDPKEIIEAISDQEKIINKIIVNTNVVSIKEKGLQCLQAFKALRTFYGGEPTPNQAPDYKITLQEQVQLDENGEPIEMMTAEEAVGEQNSNQSSGSFSEPMSEVTDSSTGS